MVVFRGGGAKGEAAPPHFWGKMPPPRLSKRKSNNYSPHPTITRGVTNQQNSGVWPLKARMKKKMEVTVSKKEPFFTIFEEIHQKFFRSWDLIFHFLAFKKKKTTEYIAPYGHLSFMKFFVARIFIFAFLRGWTIFIL